MQPKIRLILAWAMLTITGCDVGISGIYEDASGITRYAFERDGAVQIHVLGADVDAEYRLDGDKVLVTSAQGTVVLTRHDDRLTGPMGLELFHQSE